MKYKTKRRIQGSISVLLIIILLPMMVLSAVIVDTSRINMARSMVSSAGDLALNSALADYDTILKDVYGLFAMSQNKEPDKLAEDIKKYFEDTLVNYGVVNPAEAGQYVDFLMGDFKEVLAGNNPDGASNFLKMELGDDFTVTKEEQSSLANPDILRKQVVDYMKYRAPMNFGMSFLDSVKAFMKVEEQNTVVQAQVTAQESLQGVAKACNDLIGKIRAHDKLVISMDSKDGAETVRGVSSSTDGENGPQPVYIDNYADQVKKYQDTWGENYERINELIFIFHLKPAPTSDKYLSGMSLTAGEIFVNGDGTLKTVNCGLSAPAAPSGDFDTVLNMVNQLKGELDNNHPYTTMKSSYGDDTFLRDSLLNGDLTAFTNYGDAVNDFIAFEQVLLDKEGSPIKYSDIKTTLEGLYRYEVYAKKLLELYDGKITAKEGEVNVKQGQVDAKQIEVNNANQAVADGEAAIAKVAEKEQALTDAGNAVTAAQSDLGTAESDLESAENVRDQIKGELQAALAQNPLEAPSLVVQLQLAESAVGTAEDAVKAAEDALENAEDAKAAAEAALDAAKAVCPDAQEMQRRYDAAQARQSELTTLQGQLTQLKQELELLKSERQLADQTYKATLMNFQTFVYRYQRDLKLYKDYMETAKNMIQKDAQPIKNQITKINTNVKAIAAALGEIHTGIETVQGQKAIYIGLVGTWKTETQKYEGDDGSNSDSFSKQNMSDIAAAEAEFDDDAIKNLMIWTDSMQTEYTNFSAYLEAADTFKYGNKKINQLETAPDIKAAVPSSITDSLPDIVTEAEATAHFASLYLGGNDTYIQIDDKTYVLQNPDDSEDRIIPLQFLRYLNSTYPEQKVILENLPTTDSEGKAKDDPETQYEKMKGEVAADEKGQDAIDSLDSDAYGYTLSGIKLDDIISGLPSGGGNKKEATASSLSIGTDADGNVDTGLAMQNQKKGLNGVLANVGKVLEASLENIYIVNYIFENFSYNTIVQELAVETEGYQNYSDVINMGSAANAATLNKYKGAARTLSNYSINSANNHMYGAEVEYIMFGHNKAKTNVSYTKASIYAMRFAFNSIFAFTDTEIRNTTMAAGLAVQAATCGFVPYKVVQIVLQLALAAAESAIDLDMMSKGLKVVVVKTKETWNMSVSGAIDMVTDAVENVAMDVIDDAVSKVKESIDNVLNATGEELQNALKDISGTIENAALGKGEEIVDALYVEIQGKVDMVLNDIKYEEFREIANKEDAIAVVSGKFEELKKGIDGVVESYTKGTIVEALGDKLKSDIKGLVNGLQTKVVDKISAAPDVPDIAQIISDEMTQIKYDFLNTMQSTITNVMEDVTNTTNAKIAEVTSTLSGYASQKFDEMTKEQLDEAKAKISESLNSFSNTYLKDNKADADIKLGDKDPGASGGKSMGSKMASMVKFGYKDYLMLMLFISVCVNDEPVLLRMADVIELNMRNAKGLGGATQAEKDIPGVECFQHKKAGNFKLKNAVTYVSIETSVDLDMLLMDMEFFNKMLGDETTVKDGLEAASGIHYKGLAGY